MLFDEYNPPVKKNCVSMAAIHNTVFKLLVLDTMQFSWYLDFRMAGSLGTSTLSLLLCANRPSIQNIRCLGFYSWQYNSLVSFVGRNLLAFYTGCLTFKFIFISFTCLVVDNYRLFSVRRCLFSIMIQ